MLMRRMPLILAGIMILIAAGGGTEAGVFEENGKMLIKIGSIEEGDGETPGSRGNFKTLKEME